MSDIKPFTVSFPEARISDLQRRLDQSIYPDELQDASWDMGTPLTDVERIARHWRQNFDWKAAEKRLNALPQFTTSIRVTGFEPLSIHFVHIKSEAPGAIPLLFCHGWPGSYIEIFKIAKGLSESRNGGPSFHIVAPSLPNFGFSQGPKKRGFAYEQYAQTCHELMLKLGYDKYVTQGGDWGWAITRTMSLLYPKSCLATHFNMDVGDPPSTLKSTQPDNSHPLPSNPTARELAGVDRTKWFTQEGYGYNMQQGTKPQTIAYALADSPLALLSWIYEKLHDWTDNYPWTDDEICTWISVYWFSTAGPGAAGRIYYEVQHDRNGKRASPESMGDDLQSASPGAKKITRAWLKKDHGTGVLIGQSHFPRDLSVLPGVYTRTLGKVVFEVEHESGGHFAAWEKPDELVGDLRAMFAKDAEAGKVWVKRLD